MVWIDQVLTSRELPALNKKDQSASETVQNRPIAYLVRSILVAWGCERFALVEHRLLLSLDRMLDTVPQTCQKIAGIAGLGFLDVCVKFCCCLGANLLPILSLRRYDIRLGLCDFCIQFFRCSGMILLLMFFVGRYNLRLESCLALLFHALGHPYFYL
jgi:hypothetical protein